MSSIDTPKDRSDESLPIDEQLVAILSEIDAKAEEHLREVIGEEEYAAHLSHLGTRRQFDEVTSHLEGPSTASIKEIVGARATQIAQQMVSSGESAGSNVKARANQKALREWAFDSLPADEKNDYGPESMALNAEIAEVVDLEMALDYPGMKLINIRGGLLTFENQGSDGIKLRITLDGRGGKLEQSVTHSRPPRANLPGLSYSITDLAEKGEFDGIANLEVFKADALKALGVALEFVRNLPTNKPD